MYLPYGNTALLCLRYNHKHNTVQYSTVQYSIVQYITVQYSTVLYSTVVYSTVVYSTAQYNTLPAFYVIQVNAGLQQMKANAVVIFRAAPCVTLFLLLFTQNISSLVTGTLRN